MAKQIPHLVKAPSEPEAETIQWHPAVQKTRAAFRGGTVDHKYGTLHPKPGFAHLWISVTRESLDRSLLLLNRLAWLLEANGFTFPISEKEKTSIRLVYAPTDTEINFTLKEEVQRFERELKPEEKGKESIYIFDRWRYRATGRLKLILSEFHPEGIQKSWGEGKNTRLDDKLADAAPGFALCAQGKHAQELAWQERQRLWDEEARLRREEEVRERAEKERRDVLLGAAKSWRRAQHLQNFRAACEARLRSLTPEGTLTQLQIGWLVWFDGVIRDTNPITAGFLKRLEQPENQPAPQSQ